MAAPLVTTHRPIYFVCSLVSGVGKCEELKYFILPTFFLKSVMLTLFQIRCYYRNYVFFLGKYKLKLFPKIYIYILKKLVIAFDLLFYGNSKEMIYNIMKKALLLVNYHTLAQVKCKNTKTEADCFQHNAQCTVFYFV